MPLPPLHQLSEVSENDNLASLSTAVLDAPPPTGENPGNMQSCRCRPCHFPVQPHDARYTTAAEPTDSQITSSDKLSALPSRLRSSPQGRSAVGPRVNSSGSSTDVQDVPSALEARFAQMSTARGPGASPLISHSLSDSAAELGTLQRGRISFDSERGSSTSPRPSELFPRGVAAVERDSDNMTRIYSPSRDPLGFLGGIET